MLGCVVLFCSGQRGWDGVGGVVRGVWDYVSIFCAVC